MLKTSIDIHEYLTVLYAFGGAAQHHTIPARVLLAQHLPLALLAGHLFQHSLAVLETHPCT